MEFVLWNIQKKESEGCLEHFPHIKYMHDYDLNCLEKIIISSLQEMKSIISVLLIIVRLSMEKGLISLLYEEDLVL